MQRGKWIYDVMFGLNNACCFHNNMAIILRAMMFGCRHVNLVISCCRLPRLTSHDDNYEGRTKHDMVGGY